MQAALTDFPAIAPMPKAWRACYHVTAVYVAPIIWPAWGARATTRVGPATKNFPRNMPPVLRGALPG